MLNDETYEIYIWIKSSLMTKSDTQRLCYTQAGVVVMLHTRQALDQRPLMTVRGSTFMDGSPYI